MASWVCGNSRLAATGGRAAPHVARARVFELGRSCGRRGRAAVPLDQPQAEVQPGGDAARRDNLAVIDHPGVAYHPGSRRGQLVDGPVVGDGRPAVQQPRRGQQHRSGTHRGDHGPGSEPLADKRGQHAPAGFGPGAALTAADPAPTGHQQHAGRRPGLPRGEPGAVPGAHLPRSALRDQRDLEPRAREGRQRPEYVEGLNSVEGQDFNVHGTTLARG